MCPCSYQLISTYETINWIVFWGEIDYPSGENNTPYTVDALSELLEYLQLPKSLIQSPHVGVGDHWIDSDDADFKQIF